MWQQLNLNVLREQIITSHSGTVRGITYLVAFLEVDPHSVFFHGGSYNKPLNLSSRYRVGTPLLAIGLHHGLLPEGNYVVALFACKCT